MLKEKDSKRVSVWSCWGGVNDYGDLPVVGGLVSDQALPGCSHSSWPYSQLQRQQGLPGPAPGCAQPPAKRPAVCRWMGDSPRHGSPCLPQRSLGPSAAQLVPIWGLYSGRSCIGFLPWNQQNLLQHFAWIKIFVPFFTGQEEDSWSVRRKEIIIGPYRSRSGATAAHSLRGRNIGPQTWNTTLSKCLWAAQEKHPLSLI